MSGAAAIVVIGDEILEGSTTDTNSGWICRQVSGRGARVVQISVVADSQEQICKALTRSFSAGADLVITTGGLGPTRDDLTLAAIGSYAELPMRQDQAALALVDDRYKDLISNGSLSTSLSAETTRSREKMALFPVGGEAIPNDIGVAPALHLATAAGGILALPGVPRELKYIVTHRAGHIFQRWLGVGHFRSVVITTSTSDESTLDGALREFYAMPVEGVYLKSRARRFGSDVRVTVTLSAKAEDLEAANYLIDNSLSRFQSLLKQRKIDVIDVESDTMKPNSVVIPPSVA